MARRDSIMTKPKDSKGTFTRLLSYLGAFRLPLALVGGMCVVSNVLALMGPRLAGSAINEAAAGKGLVNFDKVTYFAVRMLAVYVISSLLTVLIHTVMVNVSKRIAKKMRQDVFDKLMRLPVGFFDRNQAGDIISRASYDVDVISTCMATDVVSIITAVGNHEEHNGFISSPISAALAIGDKSDAHKSRVRNGKPDPTDIHDRVNFAIQENKVTIDCDNKVIRQSLTMDETSSVMEYLTIYLERIQMCEAAAEVLGQRFELYINGSQVNNHKEG